MPLPKFAHRCEGIITHSAPISFQHGCHAIGIISVSDVCGRQVGGRGKDSHVSWVQRTDSGGTEIQGAPNSNRDLPGPVQLSLNKLGNAAAMFVFSDDEVRAVHWL
jgi:hypothetical protein